MPLQTRQYSNTYVEKKKSKTMRTSNTSVLFLHTYINFSLSILNGETTNAIQLSHGLCTPTGYSKSSLQWELNIVASLKLISLVVQNSQYPTYPSKVLAPPAW